MLGVVGRERELAWVREFLSNVTGGSIALILDGEPGIGKTTLWNAAISSADELGYRVLTSRSSSSEAKPAYAAQVDLFDRLPDAAIRSLPSIQARALDAVLLRADEKGTRIEPSTVAVSRSGLLFSTA